MKQIITDRGNALHDQHIQFRHPNAILNHTFVPALARVFGGFPWLKSDVEGNRWKALDKRLLTMQCILPLHMPSMTNTYSSGTRTPY